MLKMKILELIMRSIIFIIFIIDLTHCSTCSTDQKSLCEKDSSRLVGYQCVQNACQKTFRPSRDVSNVCLTSLNVCKFLCGDPPLWPKPTGETAIAKDLKFINVEQIQFKYDVLDLNEELEYLLNELKNYATKILTKEGNECREDADLPVLVTIKLKQLVTSYYHETNENYTLNISTNEEKVSVVIVADTYFGARHGVETFLQLIIYDEKSKSLLIPKSVQISDGPVYKYRGFMLDTSRNYYPVDSIKQTLDVMAMNKLNTFHWHITDTHSFPYVSKMYPKMAVIGAYSPDKIYTENDISKIVEYARIRGIRVIPELDAPAHVGEGWQHFREKSTRESFLTCFAAEPWIQHCVEPPCGQLNPTIDAVYTVLRDLFDEYNKLFDTDFFHMGGDEVKLSCWDTPKIKNWMKIKFGEDGDQDLNILWQYFQEKAQEKLESINGGKQRIILWTSGLTKLLYLNKSKYIIQVWEEGNSSSIRELLTSGYQIIYSNSDALYLDCGSGGWVTDGVNWCSPYKEWQKFYMNDPMKLIQNLGLDPSQYISQVLGSEAALWSEQADSKVVDGKAWPRVSALAERLWTNPTGSWRDAEFRLLYHRERMVSRGVNADSLQPLWCLQHEGKCPLNAA